MRPESNALLVLGIDRGSKPGASSADRTKQPIFASEGLPHCPAVLFARFAVEPCTTQLSVVLETRPYIADSSPERSSG